jgi:hypothetical protein
MALSFVKPSRIVKEKPGDVLVSQRLNRIHFHEAALKAAGVNPAEAEKFSVLLAVDQDEVGNILQTGNIGFAAVEAKTKGSYKLSSRGDFGAPQLISQIYQCVPGVQSSVVKRVVRDSDGKAILVKDEAQYEDSMEQHDLWFNVGEITTTEDGTQVVSLELVEQVIPSDERYVRREDKPKGEGKGKGKGKGKNTEPLDDPNMPEASY